MSILLTSPPKKEIIKSNLVLWLDGKDFKNSPSTSNWIDKSGNGNNAVPSNMTYTTISGSDNFGGVVFDGTAAYAIIINNSHFSLGGSNFTFAFSINTKSFPAYNTILCKRTSNSSNYSFDIRLTNGTSISFNYTTDGITNKNQVFNYNFTTNTKYRICIRRIGTVLKCFINGISIGGLSIGNDVIYTSTENVLIGALNSSGTPNNFFNGTLSNLLIYKGKGFTDGEVLQDYLATR